MEPHVLVGPRAAWLSHIYRGGRHGAAMVSGDIIMATLTPSLCSLGLNVAHRVVPAEGLRI